MKNLFNFKKDINQLKETGKKLKATGERIERKIPTIIAMLKSIFIIVKWILILVAAILLIWGLFNLAIYIIKTPERIELKKQQEQYAIELKKQQEQYAIAEKAYQNCLDKVALLDAWVELEELDPPKDFPFPHLWNLRKGTKIEKNKYWDEYTKAGRPYEDRSVGWYQISFMKWMMETHPEFCEEYNTELINYFLVKRAKMLGLKLPE